TEYGIADLYGNPVENVTINYRIVSEPEGAVGQNLSLEEVRTDASGLAGVRFQAGHQGGSYIVLVESGDMEGSPSKFELIVRQTIPTFRVNSIRFEGVDDSSQLLAGSKMRAGETYLLPEIGRHFRDEIHRLYATGRFEDVTAFMEEGASDAEGNVVLKVTERSKVASVKLAGLKKVKEADVRGVVTLSEGSPYSQSVLERSRSAITEYLENEGYLNAVVTIETSVVDPGKEGAGKPQTIAVTYRIAEKDKVKIHTFNLNGNKYYSDWSLNWHMKTGAGKVFKQAEFEEDRQKIVGKYVEKGFLSAVMEDPVVHYDAKGKMIVDITINEGPQYKIGEVKFEGNTAVSTPAMMEMLRPLPGSVFRAQKFFQSVEKMRLATAKHGYAEVRVVPQERLDPARGVVDFTIKVIEGQVLYLQEIVVEGNSKTRDKIVMREINLRPGDRLDGDEIEKARKKLELLGFFEPQSVRMDLKPGTNPDQRVLQVKVAEGKTGQLQFGGGYSSVDGLVGFLSVTKKNFDPFDFFTFTGAGQEISVSAEYGGKKNSFSASWTEPYFRNRPISLGFDFFNTFQEREGFDWRRRGGAIRLSHKYGEFGRMGYKYGVEQVELLRVTGIAPTDIQAEVGFPSQNRFVRTTTSLTTTYTRDSRDDVHYPMTGSIFEISNQLAGRFFGGNVAFNRPTISWSKFTKTFGSHVLAVRGQYGTISNWFERSNPVPTTEKFYLGGASSVRGYRELSIQVYNANYTLSGPGRSYALGNVEYRIPFTEDKSVSMAFFYDIGGVYDGEYEIGIKDLVSGVGAGVRFNSPLGPIRLDYGVGLDFPNQNRGQLHFSIGQAF
ncbi:MAG: outer membrane protein assembly factor BamA, partial [Candidatus Hydrogenedentota bacterium]